MNWNDHSRDMLDEHALLSPSGFNWINYDPKEMEEKIRKRYYAMMRAPAGTAIHKVAEICISKKIKLPKQINNVVKMVQLFMSDSKENYTIELINFIPNLPEHVFKSLVLYVNDCIGFGMEPEKKLVHSYSCHGTADAACFDGTTLRISDLKTGDGPGHMEQLLVYDALFCLEYHFEPSKIKIENRIYQFGDIVEATEIAPEAIIQLMQIIMVESKIAENIRGRE